MHWKVEPDRSNLADDLAIDEGLDLAACDGSAACSAVCPVADSFDCLPHQVVRQVRLNARSRVLRGSAVWLCTDCGACTAACPQSVDVARLFAELRRRARRQRLEPPPDAEGVQASHEALLDELGGSGRISDARVALAYKIRSMDLFTDLTIGASLLASGGLTVFPARGGEGAREAIAMAIARERARFEIEQDRADLVKQARKKAEEAERAATSEDGESRESKGEE
jgi:heterodisulfide reductase subunit C